MNQLFQNFQLGLLLLLPLIIQMSQTNQLFQMNQMNQLFQMNHSLLLNQKYQNYQQRPPQHRIPEPNWVSSPNQVQKFR
jgi:hypothetical protein